MKEDRERKERPGQELQSEIEDREEDNHEHDVMLQKEVNQDVQTGTNDATHPGIRWGSSYQKKRKTGTRGRRKKSTSDSESKL
jgi:hypothetical protein